MPLVAAMHDQCNEAGVMILNELGLAPGFDHWGVMKLLEGVRRDGGEVTNLEMYCAAMPSKSADTNPLHYKISWDPKTWLVAAMAPGSQRLANGSEISHQIALKHFHLVDLKGLGTFETYCNKSAGDFADTYGLPSTVSCFRGMMKHCGYCSQVAFLIELGMCSDEGGHALDASQPLWEYYAQTLGFEAADGEALEKAILQKYGLKETSNEAHLLRWLGIYTQFPINVHQGTLLDVTAELMTHKLTYAPGEKDWCIVRNEIDVKFADGRPNGMSYLWTRWCWGCG